MLSSHTKSLLGATLLVAASTAALPLFEPSAPFGTKLAQIVAIWGYAILAIANV